MCRTALFHLSKHGHSFRTMMVVQERQIRSVRMDALTLGKRFDLNLPGFGGFSVVDLHSDDIADRSGFVKTQAGAFVWLEICVRSAIKVSRKVVTAR